MGNNQPNAPSGSSNRSNSTNVLPLKHVSETQGGDVTCSGWVCEKKKSIWTPDCVALSTVTIPIPQRDQVRIRLFAAGVNSIDTLRPTFDPEKYPFPYVCGLDGAGIVESVGEEDSSGSEIKIGDRVLFSASLMSESGGTFCQYAVADRDAVYVIPSIPVNLTEIAALPTAGGTAYIALFDKLRIQKGRSIFISGASSGVGTVAVQLAHFYGLHVFASSSKENVGYIKKLGVDVVLDAENDNIVKRILEETNHCGVDYLLECSTSQPTGEYSLTVRIGGSICITTGTRALNSELIFRRQLSVHFVNMGMMLHFPCSKSQIKKLLENVVHLYLQGTFRLPVNDKVPFSKADEVLNYVSQGGVQGKLVLVNFYD